MIGLVIGALLWTLLGLSLVTMGFWLYEQYVGWVRYEPPDIEYPPEAVQVRILTIGRDAAVVQQTVNALPDAVEDIIVVSEQDMTLDGADVRVVPSSFTCKAEKKGRALEWARRNVGCDKEYILYLDEDTQASNFEGLPEGDIIQFGEKPFKTDSLITYWVEIFRMGFQVEMRAFSKFDIPLYAWGGGIAIRTELEQDVTWNFDSIIEDTSFVWRSAKEQDIDFTYCDTKFRNQAPPSVTDMIYQRRRWYAGSISELSILPAKYYLGAILRNFSWVLSAIIPLLWIFSIIQIGISPIAFADIYALLSLTAGGFLYSWAIVGYIYMNERPLVGLLVLVLAPVLSLLNSLGAFYGTVSPPETFSVTEKASSGSNSVKQETEAG